MFLSLLLVGCNKKDLSFNVENDLIIIDQSEEDFSLEMISDQVSLIYGEDEKSLKEVSFSNNVDLSKIETYSVTLFADYKGQSAKEDITISVVDRKKPILHLFEEELLVHRDEEVEISSQDFLIFASDGINGNISDRIKVIGDYDLNEVGSYDVLLKVSDTSGNEVSDNVKIRVTDILEEKALSLYNKARTVSKGETLLFLNENQDRPVINLEESLSLFTENHKEHFLWLSGINGQYQADKSGMNLSIKDGKYYADLSQYEDVNGYQNTTLEKNRESENFNTYLAKSFYKDNGDEVEKLTKYSIKKIDGKWLVSEFYLQY